MSSGQIHRADRIRVTHIEGSRFLKFTRKAEALEAWELRRAAAKKRVTKVSNDPYYIEPDSSFRIEPDSSFRPAVVIVGRAR